MFFNPLTDNQRRVFIDSVQLYEVYMDILHKNRTYSGGMHWKKSKGRQYLFRTRDRFGYGKSLGARSLETEKILKDFRDAKNKLKKRQTNYKERLKEQARFCKAAMIQRVPRIVTNILRQLDHQKLLGHHIIIVGTNAMYAYEAFAGVFFDSQMMATRDVDLLWDIRPKLTIAAEIGLEPGGLLALLKKSDRSFELFGPKSFRAVNKDGYMVDLIKAAPKKITVKEQRRMGQEGDLEAAEIRNLHWLLSSPKVSQVVIGDDGSPAMMVVPDPRAFSIYKFWLSRQPEREPVKKQRDRSQSLAVAQLVVQHLPQYAFKKSELKMFPKEVFEKSQEHLTKIKDLLGFE